MTTFYRNGRKYGRRRPRPVPPWLRPPSRPPDPSSSSPPDAHRNDIENTARYESLCEYNTQGDFIRKHITHYRARFVAGRRTSIMHDELYENMQTDRYHYYGIPVIPSWRQTFMPGDDIDSITLQKRYRTRSIHRRKRYLGVSLNSPPSVATTTSTSPQLETDTIPDLVNAAQQETDTTEFPKFFLRFLVLLSLILYVPPLCTWIQQSGPLVTKDTIDTLTNNVRVNTNNVLGIFNNWPFKYMTNQLILLGQHPYGIVQWAEQWRRDNYLQIFTTFTPKFPSIATIINATTEYTTSTSFANYIITLKQSTVYSLIATILTLFPTKSRPKHPCRRHRINQPSINPSLRRILKYYIIVLLLTRIIPRAITPCTAYNMSLDNNNNSPGRGDAGRGRGRGRGAGVPPESNTPTSVDIFNLLQNIGHQITTVSTRLDTLEDRVNNTSSTTNNDHQQQQPPSTPTLVSPPRNYANAAAPSHTQDTVPTNKVATKPSPTQRTIPECHDYACTSKEDDDSAGFIIVGGKKQKHPPSHVKKDTKLPAGIISSTTIPHPSGRNMMRSPAKAPSPGVYVKWWSFSRFLHGNKHSFDMESMCNELNILQRKFAPTLKARIKSVHEDMTHQRDTAQRFQGHMLIVPTSRTCTEADLTDILEAWAVFIHSKKHERWSESDGVADYISALRFTINPTNSPKYVTVGLILGMCGQWIPQNDALAKSFIMHTLVNMARQNASTGPLLKINSFWECRQHLGLQIADTSTNERGRNNIRNQHVLVCCSDDPVSRQAASSFFAAFRGHTRLPREIHIFGLLPIKLVIFPADKTQLTKLYRVAADRVQEEQMKTYVHHVTVAPSFYNVIANVNEIVRQTPNLIAVFPRYMQGQSHNVQATCIFEYKMEVRTRPASYFQDHFHTVVPASKPKDTEVIILDDEEEDVKPRIQSKYSAKDWDALSTWTNDNVDNQWVAVRWGIGGTRAIGVYPFNGRRGAKYLAHSVSYGMENCKGFSTSDDAWRWISTAWPGVVNYETARTLLHMNTPLDMTNLDICYFEFFHVRQVPPGKTGITYFDDDDEELTRSRSFCTAGHDAYDAGCAQFLFQKYGVDNAFDRFNAAHNEQTAGAPTPPNLNNANFPPLSVQYPSPTTGGADAPTIGDDNSKLPPATTNAEDTTVSKMSVDATMFNEDDGDGNTVDASTKDMKGLSLDEDDDVDEPLAKKSRGAEDFVMDAEQEHQDDASNDEHSKDLLAESQHTVVPNSQEESPVEQPPNSQADRFGLVIFCPEFITMTDATQFLTPYLAAEHESTVISLCTFEGRFGILVTGASLIIVSLDNTLTSASNDTIMGHSFEVETLDSTDWPNVTPVSPNNNAERLASTGVVQSCKAKCPASQFKPLATAINNASTADEVFDKFIGLLSNARSNDSGAAKQA